LARSTGIGTPKGFATRVRSVTRVFRKLRVATVSTKNRLALFDECSHRFPMILSQAAVNVMRGLEIQALVDLST
jgi:hypothetical protein